MASARNDTLASANCFAQGKRFWPPCPAFFGNQIKGSAGGVLRNILPVRTYLPTCYAADGTELAYRVQEEGTPLVCPPGGPMRDSAYLGDLGGLSAHRRLIMLDLRGTGQSAIPADPGSYRCDRLAEDVSGLQGPPWP
jgi:hypothetical protein